MLILSSHSSDQLCKEGKLVSITTLRRWRGILVCCLLLSFSAGAQSPQIQTSIETPKVVIGEKISILFRAITPDLPQTQIILPQDSSWMEAESLSFSVLDTLPQKNGWTELRGEWVVIAFDSMTLNLPPLTMDIRGEKFLSSPLQILVEFPEKVDVNQPEKFYDIRDVWHLSYSWWDILLLILTSWEFYLALVLILSLIYWKFFRKRPKETVLPAPTLSPWEVFRNSMLSISSSKPYQQKDIENAYNQIIESLRTFLKAQFQWDTSEKTASEIAEEIYTQFPKTQNLFSSIAQWATHSQWTRFAQYTLPQEEVQKDIDHLLEWSKQAMPNQEERSQEQ